MITLQDFRPAVPAKVDGARPVRPLGDEQNAKFKRMPGESDAKMVERFFREHAEEVWNSTDIAQQLKLNHKSVCQYFTRMRETGKIAFVSKSPVPGGGPHISNYRWTGDA